MGNVAFKYSAVSNIAAHIKIASPLKRGRYLVYTLKRYVTLNLCKREYRRKSTNIQMEKLQLRQVGSVLHRKIMNNWQMVKNCLGSDCSIQTDWYGLSKTWKIVENKSTPLHSNKQLVASPVNTHFICLSNQILLEIRVSNGNYSLYLLPGGGALEVHGEENLSVLAMRCLAALALKKKKACRIEVR